MYPLIRQYLRRVDAPYLALCVLCSALSVVALVSLGQSQLGSNNKASVQLIASLLGMNLVNGMENWSWGFPVALMLTVGITVAFVWYFKRKTWI